MACWARCTRTPEAVQMTVYLTCWACKGSSALATVHSALLSGAPPPGRAAGGTCRSDVGTVAVQAGNQHDGAEGQDDDDQLGPEGGLEVPALRVRPGQRCTPGRSAVRVWQQATGAQVPTPSSRGQCFCTGDRGTNGTRHKARGTRHNILYTCQGRCPGSLTQACQCPNTCRCSPCRDCFPTLAAQGQPGPMWEAYQQSL